jgi:hypothetical protein
MKKLFFIFLSLYIISGNVYGQSVWNWIKENPKEAGKILEGGLKLIDDEIFRKKINKSREQIMQWEEDGNTCALSCHILNEETGEIDYDFECEVKCNIELKRQEEIDRRQEEARRQGEIRRQGETKREEDRTKIERLKNASGTINKIWAEYNVIVDGVYGMKIHVSFAVSSMVNIQGSCAVYFYLEDGNALKDSNGLYATTNGTVATSVMFIPAYENSTYSDFVLFMPYSELHLSSERQSSCKASVSLWAYSPQGGQSVQVTTSDYLYFSYGKLNN